MAGKHVKEGDRVSWKWGNGRAEGTVDEVHEGDVTRKTKGESITRHGSKDDPALVIRQDDGTTVLKLEHNVRREGG